MCTVSVLLALTIHLSLSLCVCVCVCFYVEQTLRGHEHVVESVALCESMQLVLDPTTAAVNAKVEKVSLCLLFSVRL